LVSLRRSEGLKDFLVADTELSVERAGRAGCFREIIQELTTPGTGNSPFPVFPGDDSIGLGVIIGGITLCYLLSITVKKAWRSDGTESRTGDVKGAGTKKAPRFRGAF
jgi:hypothetical protein